MLMLLLYGFFLMFAIGWGLRKSGPGHFLNLDAAAYSATVVWISTARRFSEGDSVVIR